MRKITGLMALLVLALPFGASAGEWTGTLVDTKCYGMNSSNIGNDHKMGAMKGCGAACAKMGIPVALLVDGKMHVIAAPAAKFADHIGEEATITGDSSNNILFVKKVTVGGKTLDVGGMM